MAKSETILPGTRTRNITVYIRATLVQLKLELSLLIIVYICAEAWNSYRMGK